MTIPDRTTADVVEVYDGEHRREARVVATLALEIK
jgi:hypothetical protein